jgi:hypothetical protein
VPRILINFIASNKNFLPILCEFGKSGMWELRRGSGEWGVGNGGDEGDEAEKKLKAKNS